MLLQLDGRNNTATLDMLEVEDLQWLLRKLILAAKAADDAGQPCPAWCVAHPGHDDRDGVGCKAAEFGDGGTGSPAWP